MAPHRKLPSVRWQLKTATGANPTTIVNAACEGRLKLNRREKSQMNKLARSGTTKARTIFNNYFFTCLRCKCYVYLILICGSCSKLLFLKCCFFLKYWEHALCFRVVVPNLGVNYPRGVISDSSVGNVTPPTR